MNIAKLESEIIANYSKGDTSSNITLRDELITTRNKLDRWFNKFLDMFNEKLEVAPKTDPIHKLYNLKYDEYVHLNKAIKIVDHYTGKTNV